nr:hypothetical protein BaRGS_023845 [Batillaria attramentaria]
MRSSVTGEISRCFTPFPATVGREVACSVVKCIAQNLSSAATNDEPSTLEDERDVKWTMEVLCFGLGLPLTELDTINDCSKVYVEWLMALTFPKPCVPKPVVLIWSRNKLCFAIECCGP